MVSKKQKQQIKNAIAKKLMYQQERRLETEETLASVDVNLDDTGNQNDVVDETVQNIQRNVEAPNQAPVKKVVSYRHKMAREKQLKEREERKLKYKIITQKASSVRLFNKKMDAKESEVEELSRKLEDVQYPIVMEEEEPFDCTELCQPGTSRKRYIPSRSVTPDEMSPSTEKRRKKVEQDRIQRFLGDSYELVKKGQKQGKYEH